MMIRKKRLAFAKLSFIMAIAALCLIDKPSPNSVVPLILGHIYTTLKIGTQIGHNLTPEKFFMARTFIAMYNLVILLAIWHKLRKGRQEKVDLEMGFFERVDAVMMRMAKIMKDEK